MTAIRTVEQFAAEFIAPLGITKDPIRYVRRHASSGDIPSKCVSKKRGIYLFTDKHVDKWLNSDSTPTAAVESDTPVVDPVSITDGLSSRSRRRLAS
jgi:hypothetical protein